MPRLYKYANYTVTVEVCDSGFAIRLMTVIIFLDEGEYMTGTINEQMLTGAGDVPETSIYHMHRMMTPRISGMVTSAGHFY